MITAEKDYIDIRQPTVKEQLLKELKVVEQKYTAAHKPFSFLAAKKDMEKKISDVVAYAQDLGTKMTSQDRRVPNFKWETYGDPKRFTLQSTEPTRDSIMVGVTTQMVLTGYCENYIDNFTRKMISVFVPLDVYKERYPKQFSKEEDK